MRTRHTNLINASLGGFLAVASLLAWIVDVFLETVSIELKK